jgi:hypothetical protein
VNTSTFSAKLEIKGISQYNMIVREIKTAGTTFLKTCLIVVRDLSETKVNDKLRTKIMISSVNILKALGGKPLERPMPTPINIMFL